MRFFLGSSFGQTKWRLAIWGRWASGGVIGFPMTAAFMRIQMSKPTGPGDPDPDILRIDELIAQAEFKDRRLLIRHYCGLASFEEKRLSAERIFSKPIARRTYYRHLEDAQWWVHTRFYESLDSVAQDVKNQRILNVVTA